jgi:hypothetical protein
MTDPLIPDEIITWMRGHDWGMHHVYWHATRQWDLLNEQERQQLQDTGQSRADRQEGQTGNGWDFLIMHRAMIRLLVGHFPQHSQLFAGWPALPTDPNSASDPVPENGQSKTFDPNKRQAIDVLQGHIDTFASDDNCGLFIETSLRPTAAQPGNRSTDNRTGIHNYVHNRFSDSTSPVDMGNPQVNIENQRFWRLHGWIDSRWSAFRTDKNLPEDEPVYVGALKAAEEHMGDHHMEAMKLMRAHRATAEDVGNLALAVKRIRLEKGF